MVWFEDRWTYVDTITTSEHLEGGKIDKMRVVSVNEETHLPESITSTQSDQTITEKQIKYVGDYFSSNVGSSYSGDQESTGLHALAHRNQLNMPVEVISLKDDKVVSARYMAFKKFVFNAGEANEKTLVMPSTEYQLKIADPMTQGTGVDQFAFSEISDYEMQKNENYEAVSWFDQYDEYGNILEMHGKDKIPVSLHWDKRGQKMLAKAVNANYGEIFFADFEEATKTDADIFYGLGKSGKRSKKAYQGDNTPYGEVTLVDGKEYIVSFWARKGTMSITANIKIEDIAQVINPNTLNSSWAYYEEKITVAAGSGGLKNVIIIPN